MFKERLREILHPVLRKKGQTINGEWAWLEDEVIDEILKLVKEIVPEEQHYTVDWGGMDLNDQKDEAAVYGFNKCREAILTNLGGDQ